MTVGSVVVCALIKVPSDYFACHRFGLGALCSQAYGARNYSRVGLLLQRQLLFHWLMCIPIAALWWNTERLLLALGQLPAVARAAGTFVVIQLPALPLIPIQMDLTTFCAAQGIVRMPMVVSVVANGFAVGLCWCLMYKTSLGFTGAPVALLVGQTTHALLLIVLTPSSLEKPVRATVSFALSSTTFSMSMAVANNSFLSAEAAL